MTALYWLERRLGVPVGDKPVKLRSGLVFLCDLRDNLQSELYFLRTYSWDELRLILRTLRPGDTFVDVGANIGLFALEAASRVGLSGAVLAFEPAQDTAQRFRQNRKANSFDEVVRVYEVALSDRSATAQLHAPIEASFDVGRRSLFGDGPVVSTVETIAFDDFIRRDPDASHGRIDVVKIDVEGAELHVLRGMRRSLSEFRPRLVLVETLDEHLSRAGASTTEMARLLWQLGYVALPGNAGDRRHHRHIRNMAFAPLTQ
jgi:FkbM family methyltransferase